jgi:hypothetical protein
MPSTYREGHKLSGIRISGEFSTATLAPGTKYTPKNGTNVPNKDFVEWILNVYYFLKAAAAKNTTAPDLCRKVFGGSTDGTLKMQLSSYPARLKWIMRTTGTAATSNRTAAAGGRIIML